MGALIAGIVLVTPSCLPLLGGSDDAPSSSVNDSVNDSDNTAMLEGIWDGTLEYPDGHISIMEVEFSSSGQALSVVEDGRDLFSLDPSATVQCDVSSSFVVNLNAQYSYYDDYYDGVVSVTSALVGTMDATGNSLVLVGEVTAIGPDFTDTIYVDTLYTKRSGDGPPNESANTWMLEGVWDGTLDSPDYEYTSLTEVEFLSSGQALSFSQDGEDLFSLDPSATVQCDVSSSFAVNLNVQSSYYDDYFGEYVSYDIVMVGTMDPAGDYLEASGTQALTTSFGLFENTIHASSTKRPSLLRGDGEGPGYPWYRDASFPTKGSAPGSIWRRNVMR